MDSAPRLGRGAWLTKRPTVVRLGGREKIKAWAPGAPRQGNLVSTAAPVGDRQMAGRTNDILCTRLRVRGTAKRGDPL